MDPVQIIITIALCIGALLVLGFLIWLTVALVMLSKAKKVFREVDDAFDRPFGYGRPPVRQPQRVFGRNQRGPLL